MNTATRIGGDAGDRADRAPGCFGDYVEMWGRSLMCEGVMSSEPMEMHGMSVLPVMFSGPSWRFVQFCVDRFREGDGSVREGGEVSVALNRLFRHLMDPAPGVEMDLARDFRDWRREHPEVPGDGELEEMLLGGPVAGPGRGVGAGRRGGRP